MLVDDFVLLDLISNLNYAIQCIIILQSRRMGNDGRNSVVSKRFIKRTVNQKRSHLLCVISGLHFNLANATNVVLLGAITNKENSSAKAIMSCIDKYRELDETHLFHGFWEEKKRQMKRECIRENKRKDLVAKGYKNY